MDLSVVENQVGEGSGVFGKVFLILHEIIGIVSRIAFVGCCDGEMVHYPILRLVFRCDVDVAFVIEVNTPVVADLVALPDSGCAPFIGETFLRDIQSSEDISVAIMVVLFEVCQIRWW